MSAPVVPGTSGSAPVTQTPIPPQHATSDPVTNSNVPTAKSTSAPVVPGTSGSAPVTQTPIPPQHATSDPVTDSFPDHDLESEDVAWLNVAENDELAQCVNTCVERWRNAGPEARKKMFALFAVAGIFLAVCRHGHVLVICDMIRSGELYVHIYFHLFLALICIPTG